MRGAEAGDMYLHYLDQDARAYESEYRALCIAMFQSAIADYWCVPLAEMHLTFGRFALVQRRKPKTRRETEQRDLAAAWIRGDVGQEPLRWVDVCEALGLDARTTRRAVLEMRVPQRRESEDRVAWRTVAVSA